MNAERARVAQCLLGGAVLAVAVAAQEPGRNVRVGQLVRQLGDPAACDAASSDLVELGAPAVEPLLAALLAADRKSPDEVPRMLAMLRVLALLGPDAASAGRALAPLMDTKDLRLAVAETLASLAPYTQHDDPGERRFLVTMYQALDGDGREGSPARFRALARFNGRNRAPSSQATEDSLLAMLAGNEIFVREVAAEVLGQRRVAAAMQPLHDLLVARDVRPKGWDGCRHNGFVVPWDDDFRLAAALAMVRIDPTDARNAVAWGALAHLHPLATQRRRALSQLAAGGVGAGEAVADLTAALGRHSDDETVEALKVLGMIGPAAAPALATVEALAAAREDPVLRRARALAGQLRALGAVVAPATTDPGIAERNRIAALAAKVGVGGADAAAAVRQPGVAALLALQERVRAEHARVPDAVLTLIGELGASLDAEARRDLSLKVAGTFVESWSGPGFASSTGGGTPRDAVLFACAELKLGAPLDEAGLRAALQAKDAAERVVAARRCAALAGPLHDETVAALRAALTAEHPNKAELVYMGNTRQAVMVDFSAQIRAAATEALARAR